MQTVQVTTSGAILHDYTEDSNQIFRKAEKVSGLVTLTGKDEIYAKVDTPAAIRKKAIFSATFSCYAGAVNNGYEVSEYLDIGGLTKQYDEEKLLIGEEIGARYGEQFRMNSAEGIILRSGALNAGTIKYVLRNGIHIYRYDYHDGRQTAQIYAPDGNMSPWIAVEYGDAIVTAGSASPTSGWVDRHNEVTFSWEPVTESITIDPVQQGSAIFRWRVGSNGEIQSKALGDETYTTIPANTLPENSEIQWQVEITSDEGITAPATEWYSVTTQDAVPTVTALSPKNAYVDGSGDIMFSWRYDVATGSTPTRYEIQYKNTSQDWETIADVESSDTYATIPADDMPSGNVQWRVRAYNTDGVASEWSEPLEFVVVAAPDKPALRIVTASPRPEIAWQSKDQQAYEVQIGSHASGMRFGTDKTYKCPVYLPDGDHMARVRVVNEYNMWSEWAELIVTVQNAPSTPVMLIANGGVDAVMGWTADAAASHYLVYRDGKRIGKTVEPQYTDRFALGEHTYFVRACYAESDYYTDSAEAALYMSTDHTVIRELDGDWISLRLSTEPVARVQMTHSQTVALQSYVGADYPVPEVAPFKSQSYSIRTAWVNQEDCRRFEALMGKIVSIKDRYGNIVTGVLSQYARTSNRFLTEYTATVYQIAEEVYIEAD